MNTNSGAQEQRTDSQGPETRLATYGSLSPGEINHRELSSLRGEWSTGTVRGRLSDAGWGSAIGFPGLILAPDGPTLRVHLFESADLPGHWPVLDDFEGSGYRRVATDVRTEKGVLPAYIYVLSTQDNTQQGDT